jgi:DNA-binding transcriptional ArsR family regulator
MTYADALVALADPTRRRVFDELRTGPKPVGVIAAKLPVSRPAVSQHLKMLREARLVTERREGTRRVYFIDPHGLGELRAWLDRFWDQSLAAFQAEVEREGASKERERNEQDRHGRPRPQEH